MKKVLVVAGPTASGKTAFSVHMAHLLHGEVISGDSIQVYKGVNIGSGKVTEKEAEGIKHHLIDILDPSVHYSAFDFQRMARDLIDHGDFFPIIAGGTGLYLKACLYDYSFEEEADSEIVQDPQLEQLDTDTLYAMLREKDEAQAEKIHPHNRRRILRSLTILKRTGKKQSDIVKAQSHEMIYDAFIAGCTMERSVLYARINQRVDKMFEDGLAEEVEGLLAEGYDFSSPGLKGIGYKEFEPYFKGVCTLEEVKEEIKKNSRHYAKRQYTWLNHQMPVHWFDVQSEKETKDMEQKILEWSRS